MLAFNSPNACSFSILIVACSNAISSFRLLVPSRRTLGISAAGPLFVHARKNASTLERETGIEPATNSLEGCDSTTELLPRFPAAKAAIVSTLSGTAEAVPSHVAQIPGADDQD